jgi:uncharacterized protein (TIGR02217 family)
MSDTIGTSTFREEQFPTDISYGSRGGSGFKTSVFTTTAGFEQRNINWSKSKGSWDVAYGVKTVDQMSDLIAFFMAMMGKAYAFRFKDWADFQIANQQIGVGDGKTASFQLSKTYQVGPYGFTRTIIKPVAGTLTTVLVGGALAAPQPTIDTTTGILMFTGVAPVLAAPIVVSYVEFDVPARFDVDKLDISQDFFEVESIASIPVIEVRL